MTRTTLKTTIYVLFSLFQTFAAASAEPYLIGVPIPLSGDTHAYGDEIRRGYELAKEYFKADDVKLVFEDDECSATTAIRIANKLLEVDRVDVISGMFCNSVLLAAAPTFNRAGIPVLTCGANPGDLKGLGAKIFRLFPADHLGVYPLTRFIAQRHKRLCMVTESEAYPELVARTVQSEWRKLGNDYELFSETVNFGEKDFRSVLLKLKQKNCGALFINPVADDGFIAAFKQTRALQIPGTIYSYYMPGSPAVQKALGGSLNGVIYATLPSSDELSTLLGKKFYKLYQDRFGDHQVAVPVALFAFEAFRLILEARKASLSLDKFVLNRVVEDGAIQKYSFDEDGALQGIEFKMVEFRDGREQIVSP